MFQLLLVKMKREKRLMKNPLISVLLHEMQIQELSLVCSSLVRLVSTWVKNLGWFTTRVWFKVIVSSTLTLGWKNKKQPSGPIELDLEAGNLVYFYIQTSLKT